MGEKAKNRLLYAKCRAPLQPRITLVTAPLPDSYLPPEEIRSWIR